MHAKRLAVAFSFITTGVTLNPKLPWQILNFLSFVVRIARGMRRGKQALFSFWCDIFLEIPVVRITPLKYVLVVRVVLLEIIAFKDLRLCEKAVTYLGMNARIIFTCRDKRNKKCSVVYRIGRVVFVLLILICHDWIWNHFNKVLICLVLLPQINWI